MAVKDALDKIIERHPDVIGAAVSCGDQISHNLETPYDMISLSDVMSTGAEIFELTEALSDEGLAYSEMVLEYPSHIVIFRQFDGGLLAIFAPSMARGQLVKLQVSLGLFVKTIVKALDEQNGLNDGEDQVAAQASEAEEMNSADAEVPASTENVDAVDEDLRPFMHRPKSRSRSRPLSFMKKAVEAVSEPVPKQDAEMSGEDGVPLRPDGTPKVKRIYRGAVYYE